MQSQMDANAQRVENKMDANTRNAQAMENKMDANMQTLRGEMQSMGFNLQASMKEMKGIMVAPCCRTNEPRGVRNVFGL